MRLSDFDYALPEGSIAQSAAEPRDRSRLLLLDRRSGAREHLRFADLPDLLHPSDLLVLNDTRVIPARLHGRRETGGKVECLLVRERAPGRWEALLRAGGRLAPGERIPLAAGLLEATLLEKADDGAWTVALAPEGRVRETIARAGEVPLPPYIRRRPEPQDAARYQTVYARRDGAVAAPTAGLHFTDAVLARLSERGIRRTFVTLHIGPGTFRPIEAEDPTEHRMQSERYEVPPETAAAIEAARERGGRVVACGTTSVRTLETLARTGELAGETAIYIYPPFEFRTVGALITNFHLPRSTLLLLVAAFAGRELILDAYREAVARGYRFYSYGDAMLIR